MTDGKLIINDLAPEDRPRERLLRLGAASLSDAELLAILIGSGTPGENAVLLMQRILVDCKNNLNALGKLSIHELKRYKGIGDAKALTIVAACELGRRRAATRAMERPVLDNALAIYEHMHPIIGELPEEQAWVMLLNQRFQLLHEAQISRGGLTETAVDVRLVIKEAVLANATVIAFVHNHPSGSPLPSRDDDRLTETLHKACQLMRIHMADHVVVADGNYYSYREHGKL